MKEFSRLFLFLIQMAFGLLTASAQSTNWYYEQSTRYGTFRHYSNGGSKLVTTFRGQRDYAAEMAEAQQKGRERAAEIERQRQIEYERMRKAQYPKTNTTSTPQKNYGPTPEDLAREEREKKDRSYRQYEELLNNAKSLSDQALILSEMNKLRPSETTALRLFGVYAELGREDDMDRLHKSFSPSFVAENYDVIWAGWGSESYRNGTYRLALHCLDKLNEPDLNSFTQNLCSRLRLQKWNELPALFEKYSSRFPELLAVAPKLATAFHYLKDGQIGTTEAKRTADELHRFAVARRESRVMDFVNIIVLDAAVSLDPENSVYREERFNSNAILQLKHAMQEDYDFFNK
ncbi:MAG: hypothetical protein EOO13_10700 [Chitinophagaceae bacterium]|nr:MAG: hypothetical protein EOO13_10700 [Chitinophagaceae bacterium]